ncbi:protein phosphatase 2C domain-containing protein [Akkermansiaceae bacterium]|nr:protein phosphatase 2C domain-containing protein [Akkermansiaceae bacterium]MDA7935153.1 protein phosphatase 2C domain-containing protein [Akkermansiaceae bacterium]
MKELKDGIRALVRIDFQGNVHKQFRGTDNDIRFANEIKVLKALEERNCPNVPVLLSSDEESLTIVTTNCGAPAPLLTKEKATALFDELEECYGIRHDDPEPRNVTYSAKLGRFCLIDFELAEILPLPSKEDHGTNIWRAIWQSLTEQGTGHEGNDDSSIALAVCPQGVRLLADAGEELLDPEHLVLAVSDGMGGRHAGEFASRLIKNYVRREAKRLYKGLTSGGDTDSLLGDLLKNAHQGLIKMMDNDEHIKGMGATLSLAWVTPHTLRWAHVGDSRLYLLQNEKVTQLTKDDCIAWHQYHTGKITEYAYRQHPRRSVLTEVLGGSGRSICPQTGSSPLAEGARLMLCSDGVVDGLSDRVIADELAESGTAAEIAKALMTRARANAQRDDTTLIVADLSRV